MNHKPESSVLETLKSLLAEVLSLPEEQVSIMQSDTPLFGALPELDSMAVVALLTAIEHQFGITVDDAEITAETFETLGSLAKFIESQAA